MTHAATRPTEPDRANKQEESTAERLHAATERLAPLEEFRERGERWMKEVTAQVARLAARSEQDEKRSGVIEKRMADLEERIRSLLTLTELISLDKNPFAAQAADTPAREAAPAAPHRFSAPPPSSAAAADAGPSPETSEKAASPTPLERIENEPPTLAGTIPPAAPPKPDAPAHEEADEEEDEEEEEAREEPAIVDLSPTERMKPEEGEEPRPVPPAPAQQLHPNDAAAEPAPPPLETKPSGNPPSSTSEKHVSPLPARRAARPDGETQRRLLVVAWADLLAERDGSVDLDGFLSFYREAGWVDEATATEVERLVPRLSPASEAGDRLSARALHEATIQLLAERDPSLPRFSSAARTEQEDDQEEPPMPAATDWSEPNPPWADPVPRAGRLVR